MNIYIACSLTNVAVEHFNTYSNIISTLRLELKNNGYIVKNALLNGSNNDSSQDDLSNARVCYEWHQQLIKKSDVMIAEVSYPSLGVGIELQLANQLDIPIYLIFNSNMALKSSSKTYNKTESLVSSTNVTHPFISSMALGLNNVEHIIEYTESKQCLNKIKYLLENNSDKKLNKP
jgi:hypothetical protein